MKKIFIFFMLFSFVSIMAAGFTPWISNSRLAQSDTLYVDSTESEYTPCFAGAPYNYKVLLLSAADTNRAGFASDSAAVKIELKQVFPLGTKYYAVMKSHAYPDSTDYPYADSVLLYDSLDIKAMDTTAKWARTPVYVRGANSNDTVNISYSTVLSSRAAAENREALEYRVLQPDYSPGYILKLTGKLTNAKAGAGSRWIVNWYVEEGQPVYQK